MSTSELRNNITSKILQIKDPFFLEAINTIVETKFEKEVYILSEQQKILLNQSDKEYKDGKITDNETVFKDIEEWLRKK